MLTVHLLRYNTKKRDLLVSEIGLAKRLLPCTNTSLAWGRGWHQDKEVQCLSSVLVYSNNLPCFLSTPSTTYSRGTPLGERVFLYI